MPENTNDRWANPQSDYLIPGPGMSSLRAWDAGTGRVAAREHVAQRPAPAAEAEPVQAQVEVSEPPRTEEPAPEVPAGDNGHAEANANGNGNGSPHPRPEVIAPGAKPLPPYLEMELAPILASAQEAAAQIVERAREEFQAERAQLVRIKRELDARVAELAEWRKKVEPLVEAFHGRIAEMQTRMQELPDLIRTGLDPLATTVASMEPALAAMTSASDELLGLEPPATS